MAQEQDANALSIEFQNEKLSRVIRQLSEQTGINFAYDASDEAFNEAVSYQCSQLPLVEALEDILSESGQTFKQLGNQIVIYRPAGKASGSAAEENTRIVYIPVPTDTSTPDTLIKYVINTVVELDTIFTTDTLYRVDTLRIVDTVFMASSALENSEFAADTTEEKNSRKKGWAASINYAALLSDYSLVDDKENYSFRNFSLGADLIRTQKRFKYSLGFRYTQFNDRYMQQDIKVSGGFYQPDTVDIYYTVSQSDTSWFYVMDSAWIPSESYHSTYEITNRLAYLELNLTAAYDFYQGRSTSFYGRLGVQIGYLIYKEGVARFEEAKPEGVNFSELKFNNNVLSGMAGLGMRNKINDKLDLNAECYYLHYFTEPLKDRGGQPQLKALGIKLGLQYYF